VADVGTLQRLPTLVGQQRARELAFTGRDFGGAEAAEMGLALECLPSHEALLTRCYALADSIASKSPLTIR
jgi:enoyl-CoA hydratase